MGILKYQIRKFAIKFSKMCAEEELNKEKN